MPGGQSLLDVAALFATNWIQLYTLNPTMFSPDVPVRNSTIVNVGHMYKVSADTLVLIIMKETQTFIAWNMATLHGVEKPYDKNDGVSLSFKTNLSVLWLSNCLFSLHPPTRTLILFSVAVQLERGDTLHSVIVKFGTDVDHIMLLNADLSRQKESMWTSALPEGYDLCLIPDSCGTDV
jgi:hypothetical protein